MYRCRALNTVNSRSRCMCSLCNMASCLRKLNFEVKRPCVSLCPFEVSSNSKSANGSSVSANVIACPTIELTLRVVKPPWSRGGGGGGTPLAAPLATPLAAPLMATTLVATPLMAPPLATPLAPPLVAPPLTPKRLTGVSSSSSNVGALRYISTNLNALGLVKRPFLNMLRMALASTLGMLCLVLVFKLILWFSTLFFVFWRPIGSQ